MGMFDFLKKKESSSVAKDRLKVAIMTDRESTKANFMMEGMKSEIVEVVRKYMGVKKVDIVKEVIDGMDSISIDIHFEPSSH